MNEMTEYELRVYRQVAWVWTGGTAGYKPGSFFEALITAITRADLSNRAKLRRAFPEYVDAFMKIIEEGVSDEYA